ncbi:MAG TPA: PIN domain-containing protein [Methanosarcinaceae archaeon]|nr:PIN domain-containing protein [Methanosarcinaceae archaeon]
MVNKLIKFDDEEIFIDANIFIYFFRLHSKYSESSKKFLSNLIDGKFKGFTTTLVLEEVAYALLIRSVSDDFDQHPIEVIRETPEVIGKYSDRLHYAINIILSMDNLAFLDTPVEQLYSMTLEMRHGLLTRNALYLAAIKENNIKNIASYDGDFDRVDSIVRWGY